MSADFGYAKACADYYRKLGLCPLPSRMDVKGPLLPTYADHYEGKAVPRWVYEKWATTNIQVITGAKSPTPTKVVVVDLDGPEAAEAWGRITSHFGFTPSAGWTSTTGSGGMHHWFLLPEGVAECPSGILWGLWDTWGFVSNKPGNGGWCKHKEIRLLADNALVVSPPSIHVETGCRYEFDPGAGPKFVRLPQVAPDWLLSMQRLSSPRFSEPPLPRQPAAFYRPTGNHYTREQVIAAVGHDKFRIATEEWGLASPVSGPNPKGWCPCFIPGREDPRYSRPSGSFHFDDGTLQDRKDMTSISFFDLSVVLGAYRTWQECRDALGDRYIGGRAQAKPKFVYGKNAGYRPAS